MSASVIPLLWRTAHPPRRGPSRGLSVDAIVQAATRLADASGLEPLTMRALAGELGVAPMTLYTYVPGRAELLELLVDHAVLTMARRGFDGLGWRERVSAVAEDNRALHRAHPWVAAVDPARPVLGPGTMAKYEHELAAFDGCGLSDVDRDAALTFVLDFVTASARAEARSSPETDEAWWAGAGPVLAAVMDPSSYPLAARVGTAAGEAQRSARHPDHAWAFGLARVLDGLAALVEPQIV
ncbi:TetR/AcrR family transcriptional regulator [Actinomycetospora termitidis]|uniref:TetR/AcrR family transcriptional regulator n=1 Tax=Actinomycetospora termitidis TaxID=3053470 RepID=A0ABT7M6X1_9PSEU|nr:TetR/AcrR family transcriptional regulator [Actinomycetospora sp. Odt1-22]MDL5156430.1 TetR/AcrR family transcriptional regulator [Actinomycetospora sp. Odt1-22]